MPHRLPSPALGHQNAATGLPGHGLGFGIAAACRWGGCPFTGPAGMLKYAAFLYSYHSSLVAQYCAGTEQGMLAVASLSPTFNVRCHISFCHPQEHV